MQSSNNKGLTKHFFRRQCLSSPSESPSGERKIPTLPKQAISMPGPMANPSPNESSEDKLEPPSGALSTTAPSPRSMRKFQWKLFEKAPFFNKTTTSIPKRNPKICIRQASLDHPDDKGAGVHKDHPTFSSLGGSIEGRSSVEEDPQSSTLDGGDTEVDLESSMDGKSLRFPLRKLRPKTFSSSISVESPWKLTENGSWRHADRTEVKLRGTRLEYLSEVERQAFSKLAMDKLQKSQLGCTISRPKENPILKQKRQKYQKKKAHTVNVVEKATGLQSQQQVFGVPLYVCLENEQKQAENRCQSLDLNDSRVSPRAPIPAHRLSSCDSSKSSLSDQASTESLGALRPTSSKGSLAGNTQLSADSADKTFSSTENLLMPTASSGQISPTRFSLSPSPKTSSSSSAVFSDEAYQPHNVQVPKIVETCTNYLRNHGLSTVGIFRVDGSAKRCRNLRVMLDSGREVILNEAEEHDEHQPQDIATLLKQYLRDLPDPLMTKELYSAFLAVAKVNVERRVETLRYLMGLLPSANADTLLVLLKFLQDVTKHSYDTVTNDGVTISGNKMNARNLATVFAPSLLRSGASVKPQQNLADNDLVIDVVEILITEVDKIFTIPRELQNQILRVIGEMDGGDGLERVLMNYVGKEPGSETQEELHTTVFYTSQEETCPDEIIRENDGSTTIKTKQISTHKIIYKVHKPSDKVVLSRSADDSELPDKAGKLMDQKFPDLDLFIDDDSCSAENEPLDLIDPNVKPPKTSALKKISGVVWPSKEKNKDPG